ncbi:MAG: DUF1501 domain-containing protein [Isosphaerales bacterium]
MSHNAPCRHDPMFALDRRELLGRCGMGFGLIGLAGILADDDLLGLGSTANAALPPSGPLGPMAPKSPHFAAKAKQVVHLFMNGGPSHVDTFDPKPMLAKYHGKTLPSPNLRTERKTGAALGSPFTFKRYGQSGIEVSDLFARTADRHIDDLCIIRSLYADVPNHEPSLMLMNCGDGRLQRPSMGSWITYGLGSENQNLPGFIAMCPGGYPIVATQNWRSAFLPGAYQGTYIDTRHTEIDKLIENIRNDVATPAEQRQQLDLVRRLNERHAAVRAHDPELEARIQSFELAYRMQGEAADAFDISQEPAFIRALYGPGTQARQLLITRRLLERGVRFIQVWSGAGQPWDDHENITVHHRQLAAEWDQAIAAFLTDLKQRGLFDQVLVVWGGEFGRTPVAELPALSGRDHNHYGFSMWLAGGGARGGYIHGATDELGFAATVDKVHVHDLHATILHLLGFDHEKLTYRYAGRDFRLTDVHGRVVKELVA